MAWYSGPLTVSLWVLISVGVSASASSDLPHIKVCGDAVDWPPYTFQQDNEVQGYDVKVLNQALSEKGISYDFSLTSWSRCLRGTKAGDFDLAVSSSFNTQRNIDYLYTEWYYTVTPHYIYSTKRFPNGLAIDKIQDLTTYRLCGNHGYNYQDFGLEDIQRVGHSINDVLEKVRSGDCDIYLSWEEILKGTQSQWGIQHISPPLVSKAVPNMEPHKFYMLISLKLAQKEQLKTLLDNTFRNMRISTP